MHGGKCADAFAFLDNASSHGAKPAFAAALCETSICLESQGYKSAALPANILEQKCRAAALEPGIGAARKRIAIADALELRDRGDVVAEVLAKNGTDGAVQWLGAYSLSGDRRAAGKPLPVTLEDLGAVVASVPTVLERGHPDQLVVRRAGAPMFIPSQPESNGPENTVPVGTALRPQGVIGDFAVFADDLHPHWRDGTGWVLIYCKDPTRLQGACGQSGDARDGLAVPIDAEAIFRTPHHPGLPNAGATIMQSWPQTMHAISDVHGVRPGSFKLLEETSDDVVTTDVSGLYTALHRFRRVSFQEPDHPSRTVHVSATFPIGGHCHEAALKLLPDVLRNYGEWDEGVIEEVLKGSIHVGTPAFLLSLLSYKPTTITFDRENVTVAWRRIGAGCDGGDKPVYVRNGRVDVAP